MNLLVTAADRAYIEQAKQVINGARGAGRWKDAIMLLYRDIPEEELGWFKENNVILYSPPALYSDDEWFRRQGSSRTYPPIVTLRLYLFTPVFKKWKKIVHLDGDIIIFDLLDQIVEAQGFSAVPDYGSTLSAQFSEPYRFKEIFPRGFNGNAPAFNAGVFVLDTAIIKEDSFAAIRSLFDAYYEHCRFAEQSILNLYFHKKWHPLPWKFNTYYRHLPGKLPFYAEGCTILHFPAGRNETRPWEPGNPFYPLWRRNLSLSAKDCRANTKWRTEKRNGSKGLHLLFLIRLNWIYCRRLVINRAKANKFFSLKLFPLLKSIYSLLR